MINCKQKALLGNVFGIITLRLCRKVTPYILAQPATILDGGIYLRYQRKTAQRTVSTGMKD